MPVAMALSRRSRLKPELRAHSLAAILRFATIHEGRMEVPAKSARLRVIYERLHEALPASTAEEAFRQFVAIINDVEDALTDIPYDPVHWMNDGRIYPPQADSERELVEHPHVKRYRTRAHNVYIGMNGAIEITQVDGPVEFTKPGTDGRGVWDL